jgi:MFS transporter, putative metabolite:H+ symporter
MQPEIKTDTPIDQRKMYFTVMVAALGYFVDIYDIQLFNIVSKVSLIGIGITDPIQIEKYNYQLFLWQMGGMLLGGILWGIIGDLKGRKSVLFASILIYSLANIANGFVTNTDMYAVLRFIAGFGLAGELGAAITLVSEIMTKENRGYGTMVIVAMGALGAVTAAIINKHFDWHTSYFIGGALGLLILTLRFNTFESGMYEKMETNNTMRGNFLSLFTDKTRFFKYLCCILMGLPVWFVVGILIKFSDKFSQINGFTGKYSVADAVMYCYIGLSVGDLLSGWISQIVKSRKIVIFGYLFATGAASYAFLNLQGLSSFSYNMLCMILGTCTGYWALFASVAAEQFGTNIRATVAITVPNFVRGAVIPITLSFKSMAPTGEVRSATIVGGVCLLLAILATAALKETYGKELDYFE